MHLVSGAFVKILPKGLQQALVPPHRRHVAHAHPARLWATDFIDIIQTPGMHEGLHCTHIVLPMGI